MSANRKKFFQAEGTAQAQVSLEAGNNLAWSNLEEQVWDSWDNGNKAVEEGRSQITQDLVGHRKNWILPGVMGSLWRVFIWEQCDLVYIFRDHSAMQKSDLMRREEQGDQWGKLYYSPVGDWLGPGW